MGNYDLRSIGSFLLGNSTIVFGLCVVFPVLLVVGVDHTSLNQRTMLDPYVYAAYIHDFQGTGARFGQTYYSERLSAILPDLALAKLFGIDAGYFISRLCFLLASTSALFLIAKKYFGVLPGFLGVSWLLYSGWFLHGLFSTYVDGVAVVYLFGALACLLVPEKRQLIGHFFAGILFLLAANAYLTTLALGGLFAIAWVVLNFRNGYIWIFRHALAVLAGMLAAYFLLAFIYQELMPGEPVLGAAALNQVEWGVRDQGFETWWRSDLFQSVFVEQRLLPLILPLTILISTPILRGAVRDANNPILTAIFMLYGLLVLLFYLICHYFLKIGFFFWYYALTYQIPAITLILISVSGVALSKGTRLAKAAIMLVAIALMALWILKGKLPPGDEININEWMFFAIIGASIFLAFLLRKHSATLVVISFVASSCFASYFSYPSTSVRNIDTAKYQVREWDIYRAAVRFQQWVSKEVPTDSSVGFWYADSGPNASLNSIQSMFLWGYSKVTDWSSPFPKLTDEIAKQINSRNFLVLMSTSENELRQGVDAVRDAGLVFNKVEDYSFDGESFRFQATLLEKDR